MNFLHILEVSYSMQEHLINSFPVMKLLVFIVAITCFLASVNSYAQEINLKVKAASLDKVLKEIRKQSGYDLIFTSPLLLKAQPVNVNINKEQLPDALVKCFQGQPFNFSIENKTIVIWPKEIVGAETVQLTAVIKGKVTDENNTALSGVSVKLKEATAINTTDVNGDFSITIPANRGTLIFTYIGFATQETTIYDANQIVHIQLKEYNTELNEIVVIGYGTQKNSEVTSAVGHISFGDFRQGGSRNALDLIQGKVAGLQITRVGGSNPNAGIPNIQNRGVTTITGGQAPLVVIDGIPGGNLDLLHQDDIESIDVLKDGSGAAIYGTSANAGVILISTKKGKEGPPKFSYSTYLRKEYLYKKLAFLNAEEFRQRIASGELVRTDHGKATDFFDDLVNHNNLSQNHNLSMFGGTKNTSYRASINYRDLQGFAKENSRKEYNLRLNMAQKGFHDRLSAQINLVSNFNNANLLGGSGWEEQLSKNPTLSNYNDDGTWAFDGTTTGVNHLARLNQETNKRHQQTSAGSVKLDLDLISGLKGSVLGSVQRNSYVDGEYRDIASEYSIENALYKNGGYASRSTQLNQSFLLEPTLRYSKALLEYHLFTAVAGYSIRYEVNEGFNAFNLGFVNDVFEENNLGAGNQVGVGKAGMGSFKNDNTLIAFFGRLNYSYKDKYIAQAIIRREGSSRFGANNKWGYFPAGSVGWIISQESFLENIQFVNSLKIRAGYGITGNSAFANYASLVTLGTGGVYRFPDGQYRQTYGPERNPNPNLKWETKKELNLGVDFILYNNRLIGAIDVYNRKTIDLLDSYTSSQPPFIRSTLYTNVGTISAKGVELALSYVAIKKQNLKWDIDLTVSTTRNKLDTYSNDEYKVKLKTFGPIGLVGALGDAIRTYEGGNLGEFWGKRFAGFDATGKWLFYKRDGSKVLNDQINTSLDADVTDLAPIGNAIPKYYASLSNNFSYKNFDLRIFLRGKFDYDILNTTALSYGNKTGGANVLKSAFTTYAQINDTYMYSDYYLESGSHVKLDELTLGYTFKFKTKTINNLRVYATGQNLATFTKYTGNDPDFINDTGLNPGIDSRGPYPSTTGILFGLNVGF